MMLWLKNAPIHDVKACKTQADVELLEESIYSFIDNTISCDKVWDGNPHYKNIHQSNEEIWIDLLARQTHKHTRTCKRKPVSGTFVCRFNTPFFPMEKIRILKPSDPDRLESTKACKLKCVQIRNYLEDHS